MDRTLSSSTTVVYKVVFPAIWIALGGIFALQMAHLVPSRGGSDWMTILVAVALWIAGTVFFLRLSVPLLRVQLRCGRR